MLSATRRDGQVLITCRAATDYRIISRGKHVGLTAGRPSIVQSIDAMASSLQKCATSPNEATTIPVRRHEAIAAAVADGFADYYLNRRVMPPEHRHHLSITSLGANMLKSSAADGRRGRR